MNGAYYNEHDPFAAAWLRELITAGLITPGDVDERSIVDVSPDEVRGYTQCHFFAGVGGWSYALRLAGWGDDRPVWTGSCPCQPFSSAGKGAGTTDPRHLWPVWSRLIRECRPVAVFGEQVESAIAHGWLDLVFDDLEREGYACGAACLPAASVGAPHLRQRLWFVADCTTDGRGEKRQDARRHAERDRAEGQSAGLVSSGADRGVAESESQHDGRGPSGPSGRVQFTDGRGASRGVADPVGQRRTRERLRLREDSGGRDAADLLEAAWCGEVGAVGDTDDAGSQGRGRAVLSERADQFIVRPSGDASFWSEADWIACRDGKVRPVEPSIFPLASGIPNRVGLLRGAGNAIVPQVAAEFIGAYLDTLGA